MVQGCQVGSEARETRTEKGSQRCNEIAAGVEMRVLMMVLMMVLMAGCAGQGLKLDLKTANTPCGSKDIQFSTDYQVESLEIGRVIEGGGEDETGSEGCGGGYVIKLGKATTKDAETQLILELIKMVV